MVKAAAALKFVEFSTVPDASLAILVIVAPASVLVKVVVSTPVACAVVKVIAPGVSDPRVALGLPRVDAWPLIEAPDKVATSEFTVTFMR